MKLIGLTTFLTETSTPLILAGFMVLILWWGVKLIIEKSPEWSKKDSAQHINKIINWLGILSLVSIIFGSIGFLFPKPYESKELKAEESNQLIPNYITIIQSNVRKKPIYNSEIVSTLPCGTKVFSKGFSADERYLIIDKGYIEKTQLIFISDAAKKIENICTMRDSSIKLKELYGTWIQTDSNGESNGPIKLEFFKKSHKDNTILYDGLYNGKRYNYKSIGGQYETTGGFTPITWDLDSSGKSLTVELWTDVTEKGFRMKWDIEWYILSTTERTMNIREKIKGLDGVREIRLIRCGKNNINNQTVQILCKNE